MHQISNIFAGHPKLSVFLQNKVNRVREAIKKVIFLVARPLGGGGSH